MIARIITLIGGSSLIPALSIAAFVTVITFVGLLWWQQTSAAYDRGWGDAMATVSAMNDRAARAAGQAQSAVNLCFDMGGKWDVPTASCRLRD